MEVGSSSDGGAISDTLKNVFPGLSPSSAPFSCGLRPQKSIIKMTFARTCPCTAGYRRVGPTKRQADWGGLSCFEISSAVRGRRRRGGGMGALRPPPLGPMCAVKWAAQRYRPLLKEPLKKNRAAHCPTREGEEEKAELPRSFSSYSTTTTSPPTPCSIRNVVFPEDSAERELFLPSSCPKRIARGRIRLPTLFLSCCCGGQDRD